VEPPHVLFLKLGDEILFDQEVTHRAPWRRAGVGLPRLNGEGRGLDADEVRVLDGDLVSEDELVESPILPHRHGYFYPGRRTPRGVRVGEVPGE